MEIQYSKVFKKNFTKRISAGSPLEKKYKARLTVFIKRRNDAVLKDHALKGRLKNYRAFSITGDIRVVYFLESKNLATFIDIGTHNQVYS